MGVLSAGLVYSTVRNKESSWQHLLCIILQIFLIIHYIACWFLAGSSGQTHKSRQWAVMFMN